MNEEQRKQQAQIRNEEANIERIKNTSSEELIAKYFQMEYEPQSPDIKKARKRRKEDIQFHYDFSIPEDMQRIGEGKNF